MQRCLPTHVISSSEGHNQLFVFDLFSCFFVGVILSWRIYVRSFMKLLISVICSFGSWINFFTCSNIYF